MAVYALIATAPLGAQEATRPVAGKSCNCPDRSERDSDPWLWMLAVLGFALPADDDGGATLGDRADPGLSTTRAPGDSVLRSAIPTWDARRDSGRVGAIATNPRLGRPVALGESLDDSNSPVARRLQRHGAEMRQRVRATRTLVATAGLEIVAAVGFLVWRRRGRRPTPSALAAKRRRRRRSAALLTPAYADALTALRGAPPRARPPRETPPGVRPTAQYFAKSS